MKSQRAYAEHVIECIRRIAEDSAAGPDAVFASRTLQDAIVRNLQVLCESTQRIGEPHKQRHPEINWPSIAGMRNVLVHNYFEVDFETVWLVVTRDLPPLEKAMRAHLGRVGPAVLRRSVRWRHASATAITAMARLLQLGPNLTAADVYHLAVAGNEKAKMLFEAVGEALGIGLAMLVNTFNFPLYLLSGGPLPAWDYFAPTMLAEVKRRSFTFRNTETKIERAILGNEAGLYGAACLGLETTH